MIICGFCLVVDDGKIGSDNKDEKKIASTFITMNSERNNTIKTCSINATFISKLAVTNKEFQFYNLNFILILF